MGAITYINPSQVKAIVSAEVAPLLLADGFTPIDPFKFVRNAKAPIREVTLVGFGRSDCSIACGWSLSFVPHLQGEKVRWQRTEKSIRVFDVSRDPTNYGPRFKWSDWSVSMMNDEAECRAKAKELARKALTYQTEWWDRINSVEDIIHLVLSLKEEDGGHFGYCNYPRLQLTLAFAYAYTGRREDARNAFEQCSSTYSDNPGIRAALTKVLDTTGFA